MGDAADRTGPRALLAERPPPALPATSSTGFCKVASPTSGGRDHEPAIGPSSFALARCLSPAPALPPRAVAQRAAFCWSRSRRRQYACESAYAYTETVPFFTGTSDLQIEFDEASPPDPAVFVMRSLINGTETYCLRFRAGRRRIRDGCRRRPSRARAPHRRPRRRHAGRNADRIRNFRIGEIRPQSQGGSGSQHRRSGCVTPLSGAAPRPPLCGRRPRQRSRRGVLRVHRARPRPVVDQPPRREPVHLAVPRSCKAVLDVRRRHHHRPHLGLRARTSRRSARGAAPSPRRDARRGCRHCVT